MTYAPGTRQERFYKGVVRAHWPPTVHRKAAHPARVRLRREGRTRRPGPRAGVVLGARGRAV